MKRLINLALSIISPLASVPTGWAIYAGVEKIPAFPMHPVAAIVGAVAIIATSIAAGLLVVDIYAYNQGMKNKTEREELSMSAVSAWFVLGLCVVAEISLSLLVVVIPSLLAYGVLAFPVMTAAGVFAFAIRYDLQQREVNREQLRVNKRKPKETTPKPPRNQKKVTEKRLQQPITDEQLLTYFAGNTGATNTDAAQHFGVTRQAIGKRVKKLYEVKQP